MDTDNQETTETAPVSAGGCVGQISGEQVQFGPGMAGVVSAQNGVEISKAAALVISAGQNAELTNVGAGAIVAGKDVTITNGGAQAIIAGGNLELTNGGAQTMVAGGNLTAHKSLIGIAIAQKMELNEGSRVLLDTPRAIAFGAAFGLVYALMRKVFKKK